MSDLVIIIFLILLNGIFSMSEVALISARKSKLATAARKGGKSAAIALKLSEEPDKFLSTVQIGITLIGILTGLFSGAALADSVAGWLSSAGVPASASKMAAQTAIVIVVTYLSIVVGELFPKRIGLNASYRVALIVAKPMKLLSVIAMPAVWLLSKSTGLLVKIFGLDKEAEKVTEEEIKSVIREGTDAGEVKDLEQGIMFRALAMGDEKISSIMTPKIDFVSLDLGMTACRIKDTIKRDTHSCYPVYDATRTHIVGVVHLKDLVFDICDDNFNLKEMVRPGTFIPEIMQVYDALDVLKHKGVHCGLVCDEYGEVQGLVTLCDVLGGLVGPVEVGTDEAFITPRADGRSWLVDGQCPVYDFLTFFHREEDYVPAHFSTVAGLILEEFKKIPHAGDTLTYNGLNIEIVDMDGARIDKVLVSESNA